MTSWAWGCIACLDIGHADGPDHARALERSHRAFACPAAPGISALDRASRVAWWRIRRQRYGSRS